MSFGSQVSSNIIVLNDNIFEIKGRSGVYKEK